MANDVLERAKTINEAAWHVVDAMHADERIAEFQIYYHEAEDILYSSSDKLTRECNEALAPFTEAYGEFRKAGDDAEELAAWVDEQAMAVEEGVGDGSRIDSIGVELEDLISSKSSQVARLRSMLENAARGMRAAVDRARDEAVDRIDEFVNKVGMVLDENEEMLGSARRRLDI